MYVDYTNKKNICKNQTDTLIKSEIATPKRNSRTQMQIAGPGRGERNLRMIRFAFALNHMAPSSWL